MSKYYLYFFILTAVLVFSCKEKKTVTVIKQDAKTEIYTCPMHPQIISDKPGNCPICGMELEKKNVTQIALDNIKLETLLKPTNEFVVSSLPVTTPKDSIISIPLQVYGTIESDPGAAGTVSARVSGRIEKLYVHYRFQDVEAGQKVMELYSPELLTAQQDLLFLIKNDAQNISFINAAKQKLLLLGMSETELNNVIATSKPLYSVSVYSNYGGHIHDAGTGNNMSEQVMNSSSTATQELSLKEGMYVNKGQPVFMISNHHKAWVALQIFPNGQSTIKRGDAVQIIPETDTNAVIKGKIDFIEPFFRGNSKTLTARVYFDNMDMLTIGSYVTAKIYSGSRQALWLPQTAVISLGMNEVVFIKTDGGFVAHRITSGIRTGNNVQILTGLNEKDTVAANAQFLIDSESFIKLNQ